MRVNQMAILLMACVLGGSVAAQAFGTDKQKALKEDVRRLYGASEEGQKQAADRLVAAGPEAIPLLLPVLCDQSKPDWERAWHVAASALGRLKAESAVPCLVDNLMHGYPSIGPVVMKSDKTLSGVAPAFAALVEIGEPAVPVLRKRLPFLYPESALMALRLLRLINTASAKDAATAYVKVLEDQTRLAKRVIADFDKQDSHQ